MPISQTTITGSVKRPDGDDAVITSVEFKLSGSDFEAGEIIAARTVTAEVTPETGDFTVTLWPNDAGLKGNTSYKLDFKFSDGSVVTGLDKIYVRQSDAPRTIEEIAAETQLQGAIKGYSVRILTRAQYDALATKEAFTLYPIKG